MSEYNSNPKNKVGRTKITHGEITQQTSAHLARSARLFLEKQYTAALDAAEEALKLDSSSHAAWMAKAMALSASERFEEALDAIDRVITLDQNTQALCQQSIILYELENYGRALRAAEHAIKLDARHFLAWACKAQALEMLGSIEYKTAARKSWQLNSNPLTNPIAARIMLFVTQVQE